MPYRTPITLYNTLTMKKEPFETIEKDHAKIYVCGPTVYNYIHIGNARPLCVFDILRRYFSFRGLNVTFVQNFTDIDDKIIRRAVEEESDYKTVSEKYIREFVTDAEGLNVLPATIQPKATENIDEMLSIIKTLVEKDFAYSVGGDVYFRTKKFDGYGKLSHQPLDELQSGARIEVGDQKEDPMDFALWKAAKEGEPSWISPWGEGRPGWHIECSAMAGRYLGKTIDIHCGGQDLIFPHHENEIAQSECCNDAVFANYWLHNGYINVDNRKMSKSLGNFFTVRDVAERYGYEPIRYLMVASHYRSPINYNAEIIEQCTAALERLYTCRSNLEFALSNAPAGELTPEQEHELSEFRKQFIAAMDDDLNTADALSVLFDLVRFLNTTTDPKQAPVKGYIEAGLALFSELADVLGLLYQKDEQDLNEEIEGLIAQRDQARAEKNWARADEIRDILKAKNVTLEDTPNGVKWSIKS